MSLSGVDIFHPTLLLVLITTIHLSILITTPCLADREIPRAAVTELMVLDNNDQPHHLTAHDGNKTNDSIVNDNVAAKASTKAPHHPLGHQLSLPFHSRILSGDLGFLTDDGFYFRLLVVGSFAIVVALMIILISAFGPKNRGYRITSIKDTEDFSYEEVDDDDEISLFDAGDHKLLRKSVHHV